MFKKTVVDIHAEIELPCPSFVYRSSIEERAKWLEDEANDLMAFIRDHRSRDAYNIEIIREYKNLCEFCGEEEDRDTNGCPSCCGKAIKEYEDALIKTV